MDKSKIRNYLALGILGALITVAAELLQGAVAAPDASDEMVRLLSTVSVLPVWRIGLGSTLGGLGILMQWFGFQGIFLSFDNRQSRTARAYRAGNVGFTILGAMVHILMSMWMYVLKFPQVLDSRDFTLWFLLPITAVFFAAYALFAWTMFIQLWNRHTPFPRWCALLNPIVGKVVINALVAMLPNTALANGIGFADMGLTSLITFVILYIFCKERS